MIATVATVSFDAGAQGASTDARVVITSDGWSLVGTYRVSRGTAPVPAVLLLNGAARDRRAYAELAQELAQRGIGSLRIDLRGEGESINLGRFEPGVRNPMLADADRDVVAALRWLRERPEVDTARIGILGASYSGEAMAAAARQGVVASAYVALSPGSFSEESMRAIDSMGRPWWFVASRNERFAHAVVSRIPSVSRTARVTMVDGTSHASDILSPHFVLNAEIADWFAAKLSRLSAPRLWGALEPGAYAVGFRSERARGSSGPVRIDVWYPARQADARPFSFGDYVRMSDDLRGATRGFPSAPSSVTSTLASAITGDSTGLAHDVAERLLASPMAARRGAPEPAGRFPLVLWTPRYATTGAQSVLSEYLASHGFVVAYARPDAARVRLPFETPTAAEKLTELEARLGDMRAAVAALERRANVDASAIGVIAWSYTGEMATHFQRGEPRVALVAGLSTTLLNDWVYQDSTALAALDSVSLDAAYAVLTERRTGAARPSLLDRARAGYFIEFPAVAHGSFNALEGFIPSVEGIERVQRWSQSGPATARAYEATAVILTRLLRHHVTARATGLLATYPLLGGLPSGIAIAHPAR